ncbi:collagen alpha-1(III) chain-like [Mauremys mutica]|uniref:collagen alpha-1(III) chain-like n=1 Tax=Mauremys mutica TaxID=74926 RepID=UPI001D169EA4|nr:collagen alpha-1(III) chain-like [Mauremys mutica]
MQRTGSPIATETDIDLTAALLPSGGTRSHQHAIKTAVSETGALPAPGYEGPPSPAGCRCCGFAKLQTGPQPGAGCRLWNTPYPKLPPGSCPGKGFGQSTLPFSFGTNSAPPPRAPRLTLQPSELPAGTARLSSGPGGEPGRCGALKGLELELWEGPETKPWLEDRTAPPSALEKPPTREGCSPWAEARLCPGQPGRGVSPPESRRGLREEQGCAGVPPSAALGLSAGRAGARQAEGAGRGRGPLASEPAAEPRRDGSIVLSEGAREPVFGQEGAQDIPHAVGSRLAPCVPPEPEPPSADPRGEELPPEGPGGTEEEAVTRRPQGTELGRRPGTGSSVGSAGLGRESSRPVSPDPASQAQQVGGLGPAGASTPTKTSVEDAYGRLSKACGLSLLEELRRTFLDAEDACFSLLDSGLVLGRVEAHAALGLAILPMRDGRTLATTLPNGSLFLYYALGRQFYVTEKLADRWFRARDRLTGETMLMKKVPVVSDWRKMLHNFLFLPPHPTVLVPYAVLYDRSGSILYLMEDRDVRAVGRPPEGPGLVGARALREVLSFLSFCKRHHFHPGDVGSASIYTAQGVCFDPSSLSSSEDPYTFRKSMKTGLRPLLAQHPGLADLDSLVDSVCLYLEEEENPEPGHSGPK